MDARLALEKLLSRAGDPLLRPLLDRRHRPPRISLLIFHWVGEPLRHKIDVTPHQLARVLELCRRDGIEILAIDDALERLRRGRVERDAVVLTFDDAYAEFAAEVAPILERFGAPATLSILPYYVETQAGFEFASGQGRSSMSWAGLRGLMDEHGERITIANHSYRHDDFTRLDEAAVLRDVELSQELIARNLGLTPRFFTYPFGFSNERCHRLLGEHFEALLGGRWGPNLPDPAFTLFRRVAVFGHDGETTLRLKLRGAATSYQLARDLALAALPSGRHRAG